MKIDGICEGLTRTLDGDLVVMVAVHEDENLIEKVKGLQGEKVAFTLEKWRKGRSLNANALLWKLCTEIADVIESNKDTVYKMMLSQYGVFEDITCTRDASERVKGLFKYFDELREDFIGESEMVTIRGYFGSSGYNTKEMARLLDGVKSECQSLGIPLISDEEMERLLGEWKSE